MKQLISLLLCVSAILCSGCDQQNRPVFNLFSSEDYKPPVLLSTSCPNPSTITLSFDEEVLIKQLSIDAIEQKNFQCGNGLLTIFLEHPLVLGSAVQVQASFADLRGNSSHVQLPVWPNNPYRATVLINEFSTKGTESNPDRVELLVTGRGNIAGITLYNGTGATANDRCILPDRWVEADTYLVIRFSDGRAQDGEFTSQKLIGLSANNGCLALCPDPNWEATILDAVVWGKKETSTHEGFGSDLLKGQVQMLHTQEAWNSSLASASVDSNLSTSTRTFCRLRGNDTNSANDWYICDTRLASFGAHNEAELAK